MSSKMITDVYRQTKRNRQVVKGEVKSLTETRQIVSSSKTDEEVLRDFDLALEYGPCAGITRLERWQRAHNHGLNPPTEVKDIISKHPNDATYTQSLWNGYNI